MKRLAFLCGLGFGFGMLLAGMTDPDKVLSFLDPGGAFDPSLLLVMISAVVVALPLLQWAARREHALLGERIAFPPRTGVTGRLLAGSAIFGLGWGIDGLCPGPSLASLGALGWREALFFAAMVGGMLSFEAWQRRAATS